MKKYFLFAVMIAAFITTPNTNAQVSDETAIVDLIENCAELENDLEAQASLVRDDRVQIGGASDKQIKLRISKSKSCAMTRW